MLLLVLVVVLLLQLQLVVIGNILEPGCTWLPGGSSPVPCLGLKVYLVCICLFISTSHVQTSWRCGRRKWELFSNAADIYISDNEDPPQAALILCISSLQLCWLSNTQGALSVIYTHCTGGVWSGSQLSLIHIWRCRRSTLCRSRWSPYH